MPLTPGSVLLVGIVLGCAAGGAVCVALRRLLTARTEASQAQIEVARLSERLAEVPRLNSELARSNERAERFSNEISALKIQLAQQAITLESERMAAAEKLAMLNNAELRLSATFESLANRILEHNSERFTKENQENLDQLLLPLKTRLEEFRNKVDDVYDRESRDRTALVTQVNQLLELNHQLSEDASNLTNALKGSVKAQGNWGEVVLERVLESSGLRKGKEYELRESYTREDGSRAQPDVVIYLPEEKHLIVDSKVSLSAYAEYTKAESGGAKEAAGAMHLDSVRRHIKGLSNKNYQQLYNLKSIDFVVMFVPIEPAFMLTMEQDHDLCEDAWKKNVLLTSPSTLLFVIRTVAYLWRQEQANRNVREIAKRGAELYDKLVGFVADLQGVGNKLKQASECYEGARNKLVEGRGNLIRQAEMLKELGVKPSKDLPGDLVEMALTEQPSVLPHLAAVEEEKQEERYDYMPLQAEDGSLSDERLPF